MSKYKKQSHVVWKCDYPIVWTPKYRFRVLTGLVKDLVEQEIRILSEWKSSEVVELNVQADHIHLVSGSRGKYGGPQAFRLKYRFLN
jgi:putative transposase